MLFAAEQQIGLNIYPGTELIEIGCAEISGGTVGLQPLERQTNLNQQTAPFQLIVD